MPPSETRNTGMLETLPRKKNMAMALRLCKIRHLSLHAMKLREAVLLPALGRQGFRRADGRPPGDGRKKPWF